MKLNVGMRFSSWEHKLGFKFIWTKNLSKLNNTWEFLHIQDMDTAKQIIWRKKSEDYRENPNKSYFEKQCFIYFFVITQYMHTFGLTKSPEPPKYQWCS